MSEKSSTFAPAFVRKGVKSPLRRRQIAEACVKPFWAEANSGSKLQGAVCAPSGGGRFPRLTGTPPGAIAQLVEQRTENPCVPSSILGGTTKKRLTGLFFVSIRDEN